tara:strand:- start:309 stop:614 length:306 start_codon:yes stop_codon:yes gene_type:complete
MKQFIKWIIDFIISCLKDLISKTKIEKLEREVKDANKKAEYDVEKANESYHRFMSYYSDYQSDLKRRGMPTMRKSTGELRGSGEGPQKGNKKSENSNKETK